MAKKQQTSEGIRQDLETPEGMVPQDGQPGPQQEPDTEEQDEGPEKINRLEAAYRAIRTIDGADTLSRLAKVADELFVAGRDGDTDYSDVEAASWKVQGVLETLEGLGLIEMSWECVVTPLVDLSNVKPKGK